MIRQRLVESLIRSALKEQQVVLVDGIEGCGKTFTCNRFARSSYNLLSDDGWEAKLARIDPACALRGQLPRLLDEWQEAPSLMRYILGSSNVLKNGSFIFVNSLWKERTFRQQIEKSNLIKTIRMRPMSSFEAGDIIRYVDLSRLFNPRISIVWGKNPTSINELPQILCRGGFPNAVNIISDDPFVQLVKTTSCIQHIIDNGLDQIDGVKRSKARLRPIMQVLAMNQGELVPTTKICKTLEENGEESISRETLSSYLKVLQDLFLVEDCPAWIPVLKGSTKVNKSPVRYFTDPAIAAHNIRIVPETMKYDPKAFESFFRTMCMRDLRVYAQTINGSVYHFSSRNGLKCDAVVQLDDGRYGLVEFKIGSKEEIEAGATMLKEVAAKIDAEEMGLPSFMLVLTALSPVAYRRLDGVYVVPLLTLGP